jgi:hypothetical protein
MSYWGIRIGQPDEHRSSVHHSSRRPKYLTRASNSLAKSIDADDPGLGSDRLGVTQASMPSGDRFTNTPDGVRPLKFRERQQKCCVSQWDQRRVIG